MAKASTVSAAASGKRAKRKTLRKLEKAQLSHQTAEQKVGKLRARLERAEATLSRRAQRLLAVQGLLQSASDGTTSPVAAPDGVELATGETIAVQQEAHAQQPNGQATDARPPKPRPSAKNHGPIDPNQTTQAPPP